MPKTIVIPKTYYTLKTDYPGNWTPVLLSGNSFNTGNIFQKCKRTKRGADEEKDTGNGREKSKESKERGKCEEKPGWVDQDAVLKESRQPLALHANQISKLRELFVHGPPVAPEKGPSLNQTHIHTYTERNRHPGSHQCIPASFWFSACFLAPCILSLFTFCLGFYLAAVAMFAFFPGSIHLFLWSLSFCLSLYTAPAEN